MEENQVPVLVVAIISFVLASAFVGLYLISCGFVVKALRLADYLMLLAWVLNFGFMFSLFYAVGKGLGLHVSRVRPENETSLNRAVYSFEVLYDATSIATKSSILVFYLGLTHARRGFYWANYITLFVVNVVGIALTLNSIFKCHPVSAAFRFKTQTDEHCTNIFSSFIASSPFNIITDTAILVIPIPLLTRMRLPLREKVILIITFGAGISVIGIDVIRIAFLQSTATSRLQELHASKVGAIGDEDYTWYAALSFMWSAVEVNMTIVCACVPSLKPLAARMRLILIQAPDKASGSSGSAREDSSEVANGTSIAAPGTNEPATVEMIDILTHRGASEAETAELNGTGGPEIRLGNMQFVNLFNTKPANMLKLDKKESFAPNALITTVFFLWGFAYGPLNVLNKRFGTIAQLTQWQSYGLHGAYFGGYLLGPLLVGRLVLKRLGCAATFIAGLYIYACGTLLFWPAGVLGSTPIFILSNLVAGFGLGILETTGNMFVALCGPLEYSEIRLLVVQGFETVGGIASQLLSTKVLFKDEHSVTQVISGQWTFLVIASLVVCLAVVFYYLPIPEVPDDDLKELSEQRPANKAKVFGVPVFCLTLILGIWSQFFYVAGQEMHTLSFTTLAPSSLASVGTAAVIWSRFLAAFIVWLGLKPRWTLFASYAGMIIFATLRMKTSGMKAVVMGILLHVFEGPAFPLIFAIALRGTAQYTKTATAFLAAAISGGLYFPFAQYAATMAHGEAYSYCVVIAVFGAGAIFPLYLNLVPAARKQVDPIKGEYLQRK